MDELHDEDNPLKLDVISLCCDFMEYRNLTEYLNDYETDINKEDFGNDLEEYEEAVFNEISDKSTLIKLVDEFGDDEKGFIIMSY